MKTLDSVFSIVLGLILSFAAIFGTNELLSAGGELFWAGTILITVWITAAYVLFYRNRKIFYGFLPFLCYLPYFLIEVTKNFLFQ